MRVIHTMCMTFFVTHACHLPPFRPHLSLSLAASRTTSRAMAENAVKNVASAVTAELTSRVFSALARRYGEDAATGEKLQRLEMLLIKIHSAIEVSEKCTIIENSSLRRWRGKLKDAAAEGDEVLAGFLPGRAADGQASNGDKQEGEAVSSSSAPAPAPEVSVTGNSLSDMVQGICNVFFPDVMERLDRTLGSLEKLSPDIGDFIALLHLEALPRKVAPPDTTALAPTGAMAMETTTGETRKRRMMKRSGTDPKKFRGFLCYERPRLLQDRLEQALGVICKAVELADNNHELEDLEWLAYWAANLREAKRQGRDVLHAWRTQDNDEKRAVGGCDREKDDEIGTLVHWQEGLARDVVYFTRLVHLIPARVTLVECGVLPVCS
uniref:Uncharacterized protein n=1 Tax=Avena sativa TaxID=4498 RepID=A0ACD5UXB9_AVESA